MKREQKRKDKKRKNEKRKKKKRTKAKCYMILNKITQAQHFLSGTSFANIL